MCTHATEETIHFTDGVVHKLLIINSSSPTQDDTGKEYHDPCHQGLIS